MNMPHCFEFPGGRYKIEKSGLTFLNDTQLDYTFTVPTDYRLKLLTLAFKNGDDVARQVQVWIDDGTDTLYLLYDGTVNADTAVYLPSAVDTNRLLQWNPGDLLLIQNMRIRIRFYAGGASTGGTGFVRMTFLYEQIE